MESWWLNVTPYLTKLWGFLSVPAWALSFRQNPSGNWAPTLPRVMWTWGHHRAAKHPSGLGSCSCCLAGGRCTHIGRDLLNKKFLVKFGYANVQKELCNPSKCNCMMDVLIQSRDVRAGRDVGKNSSILGLYEYVQLIANLRELKLAYVGISFFFFSPRKAQFWQVFQCANTKNITFQKHFEIDRSVPVRYFVKKKSICLFFSFWRQQWEP